MNIFQIYIARRKAKKLLRKISNAEYQTKLVERRNDYTIFEYLIDKGVDMDDGGRYSTKILYIGFIPIFIYKNVQYTIENKWILTQYHGNINVNSIEQVIKEIKIRLILNSTR